MSELTLSTGQKYNTHLKKDLVAAPKRALSVVGSGIRSATFAGAGAVASGLFGDTAGAIVSSLGTKKAKKKDDKEKTLSDIWSIVKAELKALKDPIVEEKKEEKKEATVKKNKTVDVIDVASFMKEIIKASNEQTDAFIKEKGITDEKLIFKLKEAESAALEEISKSLQQSHGHAGLTVEHLKNIESNTNQLLGLLGKSEEEKFEATKPTAQKVAVAALSENENSPLGSIFASFKKLSGMFGSLSGIVGQFGGALTTAMSVISKLPMKGLATGAIAAVAIDALTDAYMSFQTGKSNKYADKANELAADIGLIEKGSSLGSTLYDKVHGTGPDLSNADDKTRQQVQQVMEKAKIGAPLTEAEKKTATTYEIDTSKSKIIPNSQKVTEPSVISVPTNTSSPQTTAAAEVVAGASQLSTTKQHAPQPIIIPVPTPAPQSKANDEVLNYVTTNGESTFRRLSDRQFSTAFV